jgi:hypothetical protein
MLAPECVRVDEDLSKGRMLCFGIISDADFTVQALILKSDSLSLFYTMRETGGQIKKIVVKPPEEAKQRRLEGIYDTVISDCTSLVSLDLPQAGIRVSVTGNILQKNSYGITANDVTLRKAELSLDASGEMVPRWLQNEIDYVITPADFQAAITAHKNKSRTGNLPATPPPKMPDRSPDKVFVARVYPNGKVERHLH